MKGTDLAPSSASIGTSISTERIPKSAARVLDAARIRAEFRQKRARSRIDDADANDDKSALKPPPPKKRRTNASAGDAEKSGKASTKGKDHPIGTIEIQPGESLKHFNRRVEDHMRPLVQSAMRISAATERKERKAAASNKATNKTQQSPGASPSSLTRKRSKAHADAEDAQPSSTTSRRDGDDDVVLPKEFATASSAAPRRLNDIVVAPPELKKLPRGAAKRASSSGGKAKAGAAAAGVLSMAQRAMMEVERENAIRRYREMKERTRAKEGDWTLLRGEGLHVDGG